MKTKKIFVPLFITLVMVVGAFAVMVPSPGTMSAVGDRDLDALTRAFDGRSDITVSDLYENGQETLQNENMNSQLDMMTLAELDSEEEFMSQAHNVEPGGQIVINEIRPVEETRSPGVDAGGPYGGPDTYEGSWVTFTATVDDLSLVFFRWDFDNDGVPDYPEGGGWEVSMGGSHTVTKLFNDDYFDEVSVEAWDGISTWTKISSGTAIWQGQTSSQWVVYPAMGGVRFTANKDIVINRLAFYRYGYLSHLTEMYLWEVSTQSMLAMCIAPNSYYRWNWCSIAPTPTIAGEEYVVALYRGNDYYPYQRGRYWSQLPDPDNEFYTLESYQYRWLNPDGFGYPMFDGGQDQAPLVDFDWNLVELIPITSTDSAWLEVNNAAPTIVGVSSEPSVIYEGSEAQFRATFDDPGLDDQWWVRMNFGEAWTGWQEVSPWTGGARVLFAQSMVGTEHVSFIDQVREIGGEFFTQWDEVPWGPLGSVPSLETMLNYDLVFVTNRYYISSAQAEEMGDNLADFMDQGGAVVYTWASMGTGSALGIGGRFLDDEYVVTEQGPNTPTWGNLGTIYVPGHPVFNGVSSIRTGAHHVTDTLTEGAIMLADFVEDGSVFAGEKTNPVVNNGAISFFINWPMLGAALGGDAAQFVANALIYASQAEWPVKTPMPLTSGPFRHTFVDDDPVTTSHSDPVEVLVEVRDDDHLTLKGAEDVLLSADFEECYYPSWPAGWYSVPSAGWRCYSSGTLGSMAATSRYYFIYPYGWWANLYAPSVDLSTDPYVVANLSFDHYWWADFSGAWQDGYVEISLDGGVSWPYLLGEWHHNDPPTEVASYTYDLMFAVGYSDVRVRFRTYNDYDWYWEVDNVRIEAAWGTPKWGLGEGAGYVDVVNVEPTVYGGPTSGLINEGGLFDFFGYKLMDPALWEPTEWFAYMWDYGDGTGSDWIYKGSLAAGKQDVLVIHSCWTDTTCVDYWTSTLEGIDIVGNVEYWDYYDDYGVWPAPPYDYMLQFDVIMFGCHYGNFVDPNWLIGRRDTGDRLADYVDAGAGNVILTGRALGMDPNAGYENIWNLLGRWVDEDYGPFEMGTYDYVDSSLGEVHYPGHQTMNDKYLITELYSVTTTDGDYDTAPGGIRVASWEANDGAAVGVIDHGTGSRSVFLGSAAGFGGWPMGQTSEFFRNAMAWAGGADIPDDKIFPVSHQYGDNGVYTADITVIDDDMGWTWDLGANMPVADPMYVQTQSHYYIPVSVNNVDPVIDPQSIEVYIPSEFCLRVSGKEWHKVSMTVLKDGMFDGEVIVQRQPGGPNDQTLCTMVKVDLRGPHSYEYMLDYIPFAGMSGSNPAWVIISPWNDPITPGHGRVTYKHDFNVGDPSTWLQSKDLPTLKHDLLDNGHGAEIALEATALDAGTDDLAFVWVYGDQTPYGIHIHHNNGMPVSEGINTNPENVGFSEPWFDKGTNSIRTPHGTTHFLTRDIAYHMFEQGYYYYVTLIVMDDDINDLYPSPYGHPGCDMEFIDVDLR